MISYYATWDFPAPGNLIEEREALALDRYSKVFDTGREGAVRQELYANRELLEIYYIGYEERGIPEVLASHPKLYAQKPFRIYTSYEAHGGLRKQKCKQFDSKGELSSFSILVADEAKGIEREINFSKEGERLGSYVYLYGDFKRLQYVFEYDSKGQCLEAFSFVEDKPLFQEQILLSPRLSPFQTDSSSE